MQDTSYHKLIKTCNYCNTLNTVLRTTVTIRAKLPKIKYFTQIFILYSTKYLSLKKFLVVKYEKSNN